VGHPITTNGTKTKADVPERLSGRTIIVGSVRRWRSYDWRDLREGKTRPANWFSRHRPRSAKALSCVQEYLKPQCVPKYQHHHSTQFSAEEKQQNMLNCEVTTLILRLRSCGILRTVEWQFRTDVSGKTIRIIFKGLEV